MTAIVIAPSKVPIIVPLPPNRLVPPKTTAAITSSSNITPAFEEPLPNRAAIIIPPIEALTPQNTYVSNVYNLTFTPDLRTASRGAGGASTKGGGLRDHD